MNTYTCKCGRKVKKSTNADNTGNRDVAECDGCPYLLPYGFTEWDEMRHAVVTDVQGYECRMSPQLSYITEVWGSASDKCTMHISSLDLDFMERVSSWMKMHFPDGEVSGGFNRVTMRACEFVAHGRYRMSISCTQNKKGMAAKAALLETFFDAKAKTRLDIDPSTEKQLILNAIEAGKATAKKEEPVKIKNNRCPLQQECERTCKCIGQERNCDYYHNNCLPGMEIDGQEGNDNTDAPDVPQSLSVAETASLEADAPLVAFDYAALDDATAQELHGISDMVMELNRNYAWGMANAVGRAHDLLCGTKELSNVFTTPAETGCEGKELSNSFTTHAANGNRGESTFTAWCSSMGLNRQTAYNLLNAYRVISTATHTEQDVLQNAPAALLYAAGKKDAPEQLVDAVKSGDITTHAEYQRLLAQLQAAQAAKAEAQKETETVRQTLQAAKLRGDKLREENEALKARPIEVKGVDPDEIERRAAQRARELSEPLQEQIRQLQEDLTRAPQGVASEDNANRLYDQIVLAKRTIESVWGIARETLCQLPDEMRSGARQLMRETLQKITEEL